MFLEVSLNLLDGFAVTLKIFLLTLAFALPLGLIVSFCSMSRFKPLKWVSKTIIWIIRGTPLMLQLIFVYFAPYHLFHLSYDRFTAAIIALSINYAAYFAEIYRGGIESISQGQYEAAKVLGYTKTQTFFRIILPQVVKRIIPAMGNEVITLVKDTALVQVIGVAELLHVAQTTSSRLFSTMPIFVAGVFYFIMNWAVSVAFRLIEKQLSYYR